MKPPKVISRRVGTCKHCGRTLIIERYVKGFKSSHAVPACKVYLALSQTADEVEHEDLPYPEFPEGKVTS